MMLAPLTGWLNGQTAAARLGQGLVIAVIYLLMVAGIWLRIRRRRREHRVALRRVAGYRGEISLYGHPIPTPTPEDVAAIRCEALRRDLVESIERTRKHIQARRPVPYSVDRHG